MKKPEFLKKVKHVHFVGIKGVGMTALACCAQDLNLKVSGSDIKEVFVTDPVLKRRKIKWQKNFKVENLKKRPDLVITTGAHGGLKNPEVIAAKKQGIKTLTQAEALGKFMEGKDGISVCGVGGKSTTASMIATVLARAGYNPSFAIGVGQIYPLNDPGRYASGKQFIAEADEYANSPGTDQRPKFLFQKPNIIVVTNIEYDHPDIYSNLEETKKAFRKFFNKLPNNGLLLANFDNLNIRETIKGFKGNIQTYGFSPRADWRIEKIYFTPGQTFFDLSFKEMLFRGLSIKVPGRFNALNASACCAVANYLGLGPTKIKKGLAEFKGTRRRFEFIGEVNQIKLYDDYAHHPQEIKEILLAAKEWEPQKRIIVIFQPHTFSRTKALFREFSKSFSQAKLVIITDIYSSARESDDLDVSGKLLAYEISKYQKGVVYQPGEKEVIQFLKKEAKAGDVIITLGAGNIFQWHKNILKSLKN
jgi:UDP-N-acetylmuramate--alanine ligase